MNNKSKLEQVFLIFSLMILACFALLIVNGSIQIAQAATDGGGTQVPINITDKYSCFGIACGNIKMGNLNRSYCDFGGADGGSWCGSSYITCAYGKKADGNFSCFDCSSGALASLGKPDDKDNIIGGYTSGHEGCRVFACGGRVMIGEPLTDNARIFTDQNFRILNVVMDEAFQEVMELLKKNASN